MSHAQMTLLAFRVTNFRSVGDSGWIDTGDVTSLIGTNESGKTNLLVPLWKLRPAKDGEIKLLSDAPRKAFNEYRDLEKKPVFIRARFEVPESLARKIAAKTGAAPEDVRIVEVSRDFDGNYGVHFPNVRADAAIEREKLAGLLKTAADDIDRSTPSGKADETLKQDLLGRLAKGQEMLPRLDDRIGRDGLAKLQSIVDAQAIKAAPARSTIGPRFGQLTDVLAELASKMAKPGPDDNAEVLESVVDALPSFVYYTTYGNLDSEIYLPHVIANLKRPGLSGRAEASARTLRVLFDFVNLSPEEILELGKDFNDATTKPTDEQIKVFAEKKKERSVLLQSASTSLTTRFRDWWKQGEYRIRFEADGDHFRIWVSDDSLARVLFEPVQYRRTRPGKAPTSFMGVLETKIRPDKSPENGWSSSTILSRSSPLRTARENQRI